MANGEPLPDEIVLTRDEAKMILFALDGASAADVINADIRHELVAAAAIIVAKFLPDLDGL